MVATRITAHPDLQLTLPRPALRRLRGMPPQPAPCVPADDSPQDSSLKTHTSARGPALPAGAVEAILLDESANPDGLALN